MLRNFLLPESIARADGIGPEIDLGPKRGKLLVLTLGITRILEQESLEVSVWGSPDGESWSARPLAKFPPKYYCGLYSILLNLGSHHDMRFVRVQWKMSRWCKRDSLPMFGFYVYAEESGSRVSTAVA
ncbi:MAG TPA: hypothetical protein VMU80_22495 [Bryobacteraceae bacterium]|nr:hypothetical protein [Bryobacteraceae bacterium]HUO32007.1 hypothetical protein [Bryobacteraceae bacterium]